MVVEIHDNGPLFESFLQIKDRSLVLRGAPGFRPLLAIDFETAPAGAKFLIAVDKSKLVLQGIDLVLKVPEGMEDDDVGLIRLRDGNMLLETCSLSLAGRSRSGMSAVRIERTAENGEPVRCWLDRCLLRGANTVGLDIHSPGVEIVADGCLLVGQDRPLVQIRAQNSAASVDLRIRRSTLVCNQSLIAFGIAEPNVHIVAWDSLLARSPTQGGDMLSFPPGVSDKNVTWRAANCLYAGWKNLAGWQELSPEKEGRKIPATGDLKDWYEFTHQPGGDKSIQQSWPSYLLPETERLPVDLFRTSGTAVAFRDSEGQGTIGCPVQDLAPTRDTWPAYTYERASLAPLTVPTADQAPPIPGNEDGRFHGERFDVNRKDLGERLQELQNADQLAKRVVMHLTGKGKATMTPCKLKNVHLILYFDPKGGMPTLEPTAEARADALVSIDGGFCELIGGSFNMPALKKETVASLVQTKNAHLRLVGCNIKALHAAPSFRALFLFQGSGNADIVNQFTIAESVLQSSAPAIRLTGAGVRLRVQDSLLLAGDDAIDVDPGNLDGPANLHFELEHDTVAVRRAVVRIHDLPGGPALLDPMPIVAHACVFVTPFSRSARARPACLPWRTRPWRTAWSPGRPTTTSTTKSWLTTWRWAGGDTRHYWGKTPRV